MVNHERQSLNFRPEGLAEKLVIGCERKVILQMNLDYFFDLNR
jgi:hypothetical protein